jgi:hypothetical protein
MRMWWPVARGPAPALLAAAMALTVGCSGGPSGTATPSGGATQGTAAATTGSVVVPSLSPSGAPSQSATPSGSPSGLPGEPAERGPKAGAILAVAGVAAKHTLALRAGPGIDQQTVVALPSLTHGLVATGRARSLAGAIWYELRFGAQTGWSSSRYLVWLADTSDVTSTVKTALGQRDFAETMLDLGQSVARVRAPKATAADLVVSAGPTVGDLGEIVLDVRSAGDDSVFGERLHVFGTPQTEGFVLKSVELTVLCSRGVSAGRCV